jgi:hypothetical protein
MENKYCYVCLVKLTRWNSSEFPFSLFVNGVKNFNNCQECRAERYFNPTMDFSDFKYLRQLKRWPNGIPSRYDVKSGKLIRCEETK